MLSVVSVFFSVTNSFFKYKSGLGNMAQWDKSSLIYIWEAPSFNLSTIKYPKENMKLYKQQSVYIDF